MADEFLINGKWVPLSEAPRDWLEREFLRLSEASQQVHERLRKLKLLLSEGIEGDPPQPKPLYAPPQAIQ
jgi:hypothetical protein